MFQKLFFLLAIPLLFVSGCGFFESKEEPGDLVSFRNRVMRQEKEQDRKKPRIPRSESLKASVLESGQSSDEVTRILEEIEKRIEEPNILYEDIERGWYYGSFSEKKLGTPAPWVWIEQGSRSRWVSPLALEKTFEIQAEELCKKTAGTYAISCLETESEECEYLPASLCRCIEGSAWNESEGCLLLNERGEAVGISEKELLQGWYPGLPNQKKKGTPLHWIWVDAGKESRWQNSNPNQ